MTLRIGTRGSALALAQTGTMADALARRGERPEIVPITTHGDTSNASLASLGGTGVFASALREAILAGECDVLVHSLKDLPTAPQPGLVIAAVPRRADARDALCARDGLGLDGLPEGARIGTGSPRRRAQLLHRRPDLDVVDLRGNVDTRLARVGDDLDAVLLAGAGLDRLGRGDVATERLGLESWPTAPGQGALALEVRAGEEHLVRALDHAATRRAVEAERAVLARLEAGCSAPVGAHAFTQDGLFFLGASVYAKDGSRVLTGSHALYPEDSRDPAGELAERVADELLAAGAAELTT